MGFNLLSYSHCTSYTIGLNHLTFSCLHICKCFDWLKYVPISNSVCSKQLATDYGQGLKSKYYILLLQVQRYINSSTIV